jgi:carboxylate-amine ligase
VRSPIRSVGVEEELLLVDPRNGRAVPVGLKVLDRVAVASADTASPAFENLAAELQQQQIETATPPPVRRGRGSPPSPPHHLRSSPG